MRRIRLTVAYDGTDYVGWQRQPNGISVQQRLEEAVCALTGTPHRLHSSGRTDAGVHARGMVCHFDTVSRLPLKAWRDGLNSKLSADIAVRDAVEVAPDFHARFSATGKHYRYLILGCRTRSPLERRISWHVKKPLDLARMRGAARSFIGEHDFVAFRTSGCAARTTVRTVFDVSIEADGDLIRIDVKGSGFLKNMIRMMVGTLVDIGLGKRPESAVAAMLKSPEDAPPALTAPAHGLCLMKVYYDLERGLADGPE